MAADMDIDMDLDIDATEDYDDKNIQDTYFTSDPSRRQDLRTHAPVSDLDTHQLAPNKIHIRGLDNLTSSDLETFVSENFDGERFEKIEWIDDTSANLIYSNPEVSLKALTSFVATEVIPEELTNLRLFPVKPLLSHPEARLEVRLALTSDRKQAGARERSRFYLFNPDHDRAERKRRYTNTGRSKNYRDRDEDGSIYRSRVFDEHEQQRREQEDTFDASLYDDDEESLARRSKARQRRLNSNHGRTSGEYPGQDPRDGRSDYPSRKELFPERVQSSNNGRLRRRSASPSRDTDGDERMNSLASRTDGGLRTDNGSLENRHRAAMMRATLREAVGPNPKELFPQKAGSNHRRSVAFDAADNTADLFAHKISVPLVDGSSDIPSSKGDLSSRISTSRHGSSRLEDRVSLAMDEPAGFNIRGTAKQGTPLDFTIKGAASAGSLAKELFPGRVNSNSGKELFMEKLEGRGGKRQRAEDMFH